MGIHRKASLLVGVTTLAAATFVVGLSRDARATTINVNTVAWNLVNDGKCSLPEAVDAVNHQKSEYDCPGGNGKNDTIQLAPDSYAAVTGLSLTITKSVTILGDGTHPALGPVTSISAGSLTSSDGALFHVSDAGGEISVSFTNIFFLGSAVTAISGIGGGKGSTINVTGDFIHSFGNGGIAADGLNLNVLNSDIEFNSATYGGGIAFTDLYGNGGNLTVSQTTLANNSTSIGGSGGGLFYSGIGTSSIVNSTIAFNSSGLGGGGLEIDANGGSLAINECTVAYNTCGSQLCPGAGVEAFSGSATYSMNASIVADNVDDATDLNEEDWNSDGSVVESNSMILASVDYGIDVTNGGGNSNGVNPLQGPYTADNTTDGPMGPLGGTYPLPVIILAPTSPAVDYLGSLSPTSDERGFFRGVNVKGNSKKTYDIGAVEYDPNTQAETMATYASSPTVVKVTGAGYSDGAGAELPATGVGNYVIYYNATITEATNYSFSARFATGPNEGQVQLAIAPNSSFTAGTVTNVGSPVDLYSSKSGFIVVNFPGTYALDDDDTNCFHFLVTGKNAKSSGFDVYLDYINSTIR